MTYTTRWRRFAKTAMTTINVWIANNSVSRITTQRKVESSTFDRHPDVLYAQKYARPMDLWSGPAEMLRNHHNIN